MDSVDTAVKNTEEAMFVRQRRVALSEFEAILLCVMRVLGHPVLHGEIPSQTNKQIVLGLQGEVLSQTNQNRT